jgi:hypothetical protein
MIINAAIDKSENLLLNQLSQVVNMKFDMLHFTVWNTIIRNLNCTLIVTIERSRGLKKKPKFIQEFANPNYLCTCINAATIINFNIRQRDNLLFFARPN